MKLLSTTILSNGLPCSTPPSGSTKNKIKNWQFNERQNMIVTKNRALLSDRVSVLLFMLAVQPGVSYLASLCLTSCICKTG